MQTRSQKQEQTRVQPEHGINAGTHKKAHGFKLQPLFSYFHGFKWLLFSGPVLNSSRSLRSSSEDIASTDSDPDVAQYFSAWEADTCGRVRLYLQQKTLHIRILSGHCVFRFHEASPTVLATAETSALVVPCALDQDGPAPPDDSVSSDSVVVLSFRQQSLRLL